MSRTSGLLILLLFIIAQYSNTHSEENQGNSAAIDRGKFIVERFGCHTCHSPKIETEQGFIPDPDRLLSGHPAQEKMPDIPANLIGPGKWAGIYSMSLTAWAGPWGVSYAANLTPDKETGIGNWSRENFVSTIKLGIHTKTLPREISAPMPWEQISMLSDEDLSSVYDYLFTLKPVKNKVPVHTDLVIE